MSLALLPYVKKLSWFSLFLTTIVVIFDGNFVLYLFLSFDIPSLKSDTNWSNFARIITTGGRSSILLFFICLLQINILPVFDNKNSQPDIRALTFWLSMFRINLMSKFLEISESKEQTFLCSHRFSSMIFSKISLTEFPSSRYINLPPESVKFFAKIKSKESSLGKWMFWFSISTSFFFFTLL